MNLIHGPFLLISVFNYFAGVAAGAGAGAGAGVGVTFPLIVIRLVAGVVFEVTVKVLLNIPGRP